MKLKIGSREWWEMFLKKTNDLRKADVFKDCLSDQIVELKELIFDVLRKIEEPNSLRVYLDGVLKESNNKIIYNHRPLLTETIEEWSERAFGEEKFGIILNNCQDYSDNLSKKICDFFSPLIDLLGLPLGGIEITFFIGNYPYTPLGFHLDPIGHKVTHFHLGPDSKKMYLIEPEVYEKDLVSITDGKGGFKDYEKILGYASSYEINAGDMFFMPYGKYHVGSNPGLSAAITVWHIEPSKSEVQKQLNLLFLKKIFSKESKDVVHADKGPLEDSEYIENCLSDTIEIDAEYENLGIQKILSTLIKDYKLSLVSNAGLASSAKVLEGSKEVGIENEIIVNKPFRILQKQIEGGSVLFIRGNRIVLPENGGLKSVIDTINQGNSIKVEDLISPLLLEWDDETAIYFINELYKYRGIEILS